MFLVHGSADPISVSNHSVFMYMALAGPANTELHVYAGALQGFSARPISNPCGTWTRSCADWMRHQGFLKASQ